VPASAVINSPDALHKIEAEDGDSVFYIEETNELVILSTEGYIRTYFKPEDGIDYYNRQ
jgi:pyocin large subunit-like protein